jgi:lipopolysaccharide export system permease protein
LKKADKLVLVSFLGPFFVTFFVTLFVLLMQFLWKYIDDLVGKGLEWYTVAHLLFYAVASFVPLALPISTLLSMLMTMGALGEHYELSALKTAGVSLTRIMRPLMIAAIIISIGAFLFSNYMLPVANLKFGSLLYDIEQQKPALNIKQGVFYNGIQNYSIHVGRKAPDNKTIYDVLIYDHTSGRGDDDVLYADKGEMAMTKDKQYLIFTLHNGSQFQEVPPSDSKPHELEQTRVTFKTWQKIFDLSQFNLSRTKEDLFKDNYQMLNLKQLNNAIDTFNIQLKKKYATLNNYVTPSYNFLRPDVRAALLASKPITVKNDSSFLSTVPSNERMAVMQQSLNSIRSVKGFTSIMSSDVLVTKQLIESHEYEWWQKITLSLSCFILFLVGAPLGAIVRKGGIGLPIVIAILMFLLLYVILITGKKLASDLTISPFLGSWLPNLVLLPISIFLTYKATHDSQLLSLEMYDKFFKRIAAKLHLTTPQ